MRRGLPLPNSASGRASCIDAPPIPGWHEPARDPVQDGQGHLGHRPQSGRSPAAVARAQAGAATAVRPYRWPALAPLLKMENPRPSGRGRRLRRRSRGSRWWLRGTPSDWTHRSPGWDDWPAPSTSAGRTVEVVDQPTCDGEARDDDECAERRRSECAEKVGDLVDDGPLGWGPLDYLARVVFATFNDDKLNVIPGVVQGRR